MPILIMLLSLTGALMLDAPFNVDKVAFHGSVDKEGKTYSCTAVTNEDRNDIIAHIRDMMTNNSLNGEELLYENQNTYSYEYFARNIGGHIFTLTKRDCDAGLMELGQVPTGTVHGG